MHISKKILIKLQETLLITPRNKLSKSLMKL